MKFISRHHDTFIQCSILKTQVRNWDIDESDNGLIVSISRSNLRPLID